MQRRAQRCRPQLVEANDAVVRNARAFARRAVAQRQRVRALCRILGRLSEKKRTAYMLHEIRPAARGHRAAGAVLPCSPCVRGCSTRGARSSGA